ncbi:hypothetical protein [Proteus mirabilis]|uniref:hypothetical protein n=1 Tax=Proteus mirabilis TaxID=584 RepID=UPI00068FB818|nr:hypothetical protein [Proteus mirabilis]AUU15754.1 hypothetical protein MC53_017795 [Proteus mirabilis]ELA7863842.1 hypothetical protein [Proteus mirabilis]MBB6724339.1 hypothetical protein [Proteus mirabilis]MBG3138919.1 hypothetical protein [Proteus mirabilis]MCL8589277.1 hypothetical protein [Proteus mirabilis]
MNNELKRLEKKYNSIMVSPSEKESQYYNSVMSIFSYKKISKGRLYNIKPYEIQRAGLNPGKELKENPKKIKGVCVYYFDSKDNILLIEIYGQNENIINRHYYFHTVNQIKSIYFNSEYQSIRNIDLLKCKNGQVMEVLNYGEMGSSISNYIYDSGKLIEIDIKQKEHNKNEIAKYKVYFEYKDDILNRIVDKHPNGYEEQRYP